MTGAVDRWTNLSVSVAVSLPGNVMSRHDIYLVPGFFGFSNLGGITYFHHVREALEEEFERRGESVRAHGVSTLPTASIRRRTVRLADEIEKTASDDGPVHLIGHSTGGLDTRLLATPGVNLETEVDVAALGDRIESVVTISTPHLGTPIASIFNSLFGQRILWAVSLGTIYTLRFGKLPLKALFELIGLLSRIDRRLGLENTIREQIHRELLADFGEERGAEINEFLSHIRQDRSVIAQLTAGSVDLFNASTANRPEARYGCVLTRAPGVSLRAAMAVKFNVYAHASHVFFRLLQTLTARNSHYFDVRPEQTERIEEAYDRPLSPRSNDGVVPTLSQLWGELIHAARADHLDVCGHFRDPEHDPPHVDWLMSGAGFRRPQFDALWSEVAEFLLRSD